MAKDVLGADIEVGDLVLYHYASTKASPLVAGNLYKVNKVYPQQGKIAVHFIFEEKTLTVEENGTYFLKVRDLSNVNGVLHKLTNYEAAAEEIMKLINSKPRSPRKEEIIKCLQQHNG